MLFKIKAEKYGWVPVIDLRNFLHGPAVQKKYSFPTFQNFDIVLGDDPNAVLLRVHSVSNAGETGVTLKRSDISTSSSAGNRPIK